MSIKTIVTNEPSPNFCILSAHDDSYSKIAETTVYQNKAEYAKRWGYDLMTLTNVNPAFHDPGSHINGLTWDRLREAVLLAKSGRYDWLYLVGADTLITNMTIPLTEFADNDYHFVIANDCCEWNADSFFFRCSLAGIGFMEAVMAEYERLKHHCWVEQQAMIELRDLPEWRGIWKVLPQRKINSYNYPLYVDDKHCQPAKRLGKDFAGNDGQWQPGDFLIHWAGLSTDIRYRQIEKVLPQIIR
jgi:hypothetical protein